MMIDEQTLEDLEFTTIREWLIEFAIGPTLVKEFNDLRPYTNEQELRKELLRVDEFKKIRIEGETFPAIQFEELESEIKLLPIQNASIPLEGFIRILNASKLANQVIYFFDKRESDYPEMAKITSGIYHTTELIDAIELVFDKYGNVKDDASEELTNIRQNIQHVKKQINKNFQKELRRLAKDHILGDTKETFINERRVLTILSSHKRKVAGNIVGASKTGSLTYIEPEINVPLNNELELLEDDERKEIFRILQVLKKQLLNHLELIQAYQLFLVNIDRIQAKTRLALQINGNLPSLSENQETELIDAFHPILWVNNQAQKKSTHPQRITMSKFARMLVISGPNAGGKSITLKTVGLLQIMLQSGLLLPIHKNSVMCLYQNILSDIGDNQSISNELSTYSYRLKRMNTFLEVANKKTLFLLDEFGTGSDPDLGGALAEVIFETLYNKKSFAVITTHYNNIKLKADILKNAVNGSMLFNTETLEPTYTFSAGQPGSSFTFEVAKINGIPDEIIAEAKNRLDDKKVKMDRLLNELQKEKSYLKRLNKEHIIAQELASDSLEKYEEKRELYETKLQSIRENRELNSKLNQYGKKLLSYIEKYNLNTKKKSINNSLLEEVRKYLAVEKSKIASAKEQTKMERIKNRQKKKSPKAQPKQDVHNRSRIKAGSRVKLITSRQIGTVEEINGENVVVTFGFAKMKVKLDKLSWVEN